MKNKKRNWRRVEGASERKEKNFTRLHKNKCKEKKEMDFGPWLHKK